MKFKSRLFLLATAMAVTVTGFPIFASESDNQIESSVNSTYVFRTILGSDVMVKSSEGVVTLSGSVDEVEFIELATDTVSGLPGVVRVDNELSVTSSVPAKNSDAWLMTKVKTTLLFHRNVSAMTKVEAADGVITLSGNADNQAEKDLTGEYALDVEGVTKVNNNMRIVATPEKEASPLEDKIDDASITAQVKMVLLTHRSTSALLTSVTTDNGVVTLSGEAKNDAEVALATKISEDIKGVSKVNNIMTVATTR